MFIFHNDDIALLQVALGRTAERQGAQKLDKLARHRYVSEVPTGSASGNLLPDLRGSLMRKAGASGAKAFGK